MKKNETIIAAIPRDMDIPYEELSNYEIICGIDMSKLLERLVEMINDRQIDIDTFKLRITTRRTYNHNPIKRGEYTI